MKRIMIMATLLSGCALLSKSAPVKLRYFAAEDVAATAAPVPTAAPVRLRLGRVVASSYLRDRIAYRDGTAEVGFYGTLRWADQPDAYLSRGLSRALFVEQGAQEIVSGAGPTLDVDLEAFDEVRAPRHVARVVVTWRVRGDRTVLAQHTVVVEVPIAVSNRADVGNAIAAAMAQALHDAVTQSATAVVAALAKDATVPATAELGARKG